MTIISLLDLPIDLPPEAKTRCHDLQTFSSGLPEYLSRCMENLDLFLNIAHIDET
jgi:protein farnesyltransferase subunit beta